MESVKQLINSLYNLLHRGSRLLKCLDTKKATEVALISLLIEWLLFNERGLLSVHRNHIHSLGKGTDIYRLGITR